LSSLAKPAAIAALGAFTLALALPAQQPEAPSTAGLVSGSGLLSGSGLHYRMVGPDRGGRVTAVTGVAQDPQTYYMGTVGGGVWKTTNAGHTWNNLTDGQFSVGSMGALAVAPSDPNVLYAGTGSSKIRSNVSIGRGIYKSVDAGKTWQFLGLRDVGQIATVRVNPTDPKIVFVAAQGNPFAPTKDRGVYKSVDGGKTWKHTLFLSDELGAADLELAPADPNTVFACMWHGQRKPWTIVSGSMDGGIYKSTDGGETWAKLGGGLPTGLFGRANVALSLAAPRRVFALIEAKPGAGLYRSDDLGATWTLVNGQDRLTTRPFYYDTLGVDPTNADVVYVGDEAWMKSTDAGKTFRTARTPHGDNHDLWINPTNSNYMIQANDGGANVSLDGGLSWSTQANQPTAELYQVAVDDQFPYRLYGAQQDNTTVIVPSLPLGDGQDFREGPGCETGPIIPKMGDPDVVWGGCKGQFSRENINTRDEETYWIGGESLYGNEPYRLKYRFQRVAPMEISPFEPNTVYYGSQYVHRTRDGGITWETISPDLTAHPAGTQAASGEPITRDATGEEVYSVVYAIRESPLKKGVIWAGSNDGLVWVTEDDGKSWKNVTPAGLPPGGRVQNIEPGRRQPGTAYVALYRYFLGDFSPYLYATHDFGRHWEKLTDGTNGIAADEPTRVIREDPERPGLLFAGTEFGIYASFDSGAHWKSIQLNLPVVPVTDIKVAHKDLVLSTQGRSFWILDNITPLEQASVAETTLFKPREAVRVPGNSGGGLRVSESGAPQYPLMGAQIDYLLPSAATTPLTLNILDKSGKVIRSFSSVAPPESRGRRGEEEGGDDEEGGFRVPYPSVLETTAGLHRFTWDLRVTGGWAGDGRPPAANGPVVPPGDYQVQLIVGAFKAVQPLHLIEDPRVTKDGVTTADLQAQFEHNLKVLKLVDDTNRLVARLRAAQTAARTDKSASPLKLAELQKLSDDLITPRIRYSQPALQTHVTYLYSMVNRTDQRIGHDAVERYTELRKLIDAEMARLNGAIGPEPPNTKIATAGLDDEDEDDNN
jgi:photosystem II stability/assembly factor-like uncharacterized protein